MYWTVLILGILAAVLFLYVRVTQGGVKGAMTKAFASSLFVATGVAAFAGSGAAVSAFPCLVIVGLIFGLLGDVWLDLKWVYPNDNDIYTFAGFISFAIGHVLYLTALFLRYADFSKPLYIVVPLVLAAVIGVAVVSLEKPMKLVYGKFKTISGIYAAILVFMTLLSGSLALMNGFKETTLNFMFVGGVLFLVSDLILSGTYFGEGKDRPIDVITNHVSYYASQFIIASSLLFLSCC